MARKLEILATAKLQKVYIFWVSIPPRPPPPPQGKAVIHSHMGRHLLKILLKALDYI